MPLKKAGIAYMLRMLEVMQGGSPMKWRALILGLLSVSLVRSNAAAQNPAGGAPPPEIVVKQEEGKKDGDRKLYIGLELGLKSDAKSGAKDKPGIPQTITFYNGAPGANSGGEPAYIYKGTPRMTPLAKIGDPALARMAGFLGVKEDTKLADLSESEKNTVKALYVPLVNLMAVRCRLKGLPESAAPAEQKASDGMALRGAEESLLKMIVDAADACRKSSVANKVLCDETPPKCPR